MLNSQPIHHPGTKDVDILFDGGYEKGSLKEIIEEFIKYGFIFSAKHDFQLFKEIEVMGKKFVYNVDLLHPLETIKPDEIYVEHIDLGIPASKYQGETYIMKSIALPSSQSLFKNSIITYYQFNNEGDNEKSTKIPLMSEAGTLITKSQSVLIPKRYRDSLDIYFAIAQNQSYELLISSIIDIRKTDRETYNSLYGIRKAYEEGIMFGNISRFADVNKTDFDKIMRLFFEQVGLNNKAE